QSGGAIPGATVTATNQATNVNYTAVSNEAGNYTITSVPVGTYVVKAELTGFKTAATAAVDLEAKQIGRFDFKLEIGAIAENVQVVGQSPLLQTETATVGEVISGSTVVHGNAFEFYRNSDFDANTWDNIRSNAPKAQRTQHIFGGTLGGPLKKDKWFIFGDYQGTRFNAPGTENVSVAPASWRTGDLSSAGATIRDPLTGAAFPGNQVPAARISPVARAILTNTALYPLPNRSVNGVSGNYVG